MPYEARCQRCGETFCPSDPTDLVHTVRQGDGHDGEDCGGDGTLLGEWS